MIVGECEQREVYKHYAVFGNGPDSVLETSVWLIVLIGKYNGVFYNRDEPYFVCAHSAGGVN